MKIILVIPTYNERQNIQRLIPALQAQFSKLPAHAMGILVVDDNSPDGTAAVVQQAIAQYDNVELITGIKAGLGAAYIRGMQHALGPLGADAVFEMDADFSHKPEDVPRMVAMLDAGHDFVIGSRYVDGGSIPSNWGFMRRMNSRFGNVVARYVAGMRRVKDCTAGFRAIRAETLKRIDFQNLKVRGYAFQVALLNAAFVNGARIKEIPVDFIDRTHGESKLGWSDITEFILNAWWIRLQSLKTFIKFCIVGGSGVVINLGAFTLLLLLDVNKYLASPIAIELSIVWNFFLNNYWTFRWRKNQNRKRIRALKFNATSLLALGVSYSTFLLMSQSFPELPPQIPQFVGIIPATLVNYFLNSYWTFREGRSARS